MNNLVSEDYNSGLQHSSSQANYHPIQAVQSNHRRSTSFSHSLPGSIDENISRRAPDRPRRSNRKIFTNRLLQRSYSDDGAQINFSKNAKLGWNAVKKSLNLKKLKKASKDSSDSHQSYDIGIYDALLIAVPPILMTMLSVVSSDYVNRDICVLPQLLKITVDQEIHELGRRYYLITLEYGIGLFKSTWTIKRENWEILNLHSKIKLSNFRYPETLPKFPKSIIHLAFNSKTNSESVSRTPTEESAARFNSQSVARALSFTNLIATANDSNCIDQSIRFVQQHRSSLVEEYLQKLIYKLFFRKAFSHICRFLEISAIGINLSHLGGYHGKEGYTKIVKSKGAGGWFWNFSLFDKLKIGDTVWTIVRDSCVIFTENFHTLTATEVFLFDDSFEFSSTVSSKDKAKKYKSTGLKKLTLLLKNKERMIKLDALTEKNLLQFSADIQRAKNNSVWAKPHRFGSFAPTRQNCAAQWFVDARDYYWNLSRAISYAKHCIYIHDWWLSPELYLRRPAYLCKEWRLDHMLKKKADQGVKVFVILYNNFGAAIPIDSFYTKKRLTSLSPNIYVIRSPSHLRQSTFFWAHHEKLCIIDNFLGFVGGLDLCFGRYDSSHHILADHYIDTENQNSEAAELSYDDPLRYIWPGKDYSNARVRDFYELDQPFSNMYDRSKVPRMGWHDIHLQVNGQIARDIARHFVQRWNYLLRYKSFNKFKPILIPPPDFTIEEMEHLNIIGDCEAQVLRSCSLWSIGSVNHTEQSILNAYVAVIRASEHYIYMENQFFITNTKFEGTVVKNEVGNAIYDRIVKAKKDGKKWFAYILIPLLPGFQNCLHEPDGTSVRLIMHAQFRSISRGETSLYARLRKEGIDPMEYLRFYSLRSWAKIGQADHYVTEMVYIHAKCLICDDRITIIGSANINERSMRGNRDSEVAVIIRDTNMIDSTMNGKPYKAGKFSHSLRMRLMREHLGFDTDRIEFTEHSMTNLVSTTNQWIERDEWMPKSRNSFMGAPKIPSEDQYSKSEIERSRIMTETDAIKKTSALEYYVQTNKIATHIDDTNQNNVSAQIYSGVNDVDKQSIGERLTEAIPIEDSIPRSWTRFERQGPRDCHRAKKTQQNANIYKEKPHCGSGIDYEDIEIQNINPITGKEIPQYDLESCRDPLSEYFMRDIWNTIASNNTLIYQRCFFCIPDNDIQTWKDYNEYQSRSHSLMRMQGLQSSPTTREGARVPDSFEEEIIEQQTEAFSSTGKSKKYSLNGRPDSRLNRDTTAESSSKNSPDALNVEDTRKMLGAIRGHLVIWPTDFLSEADEQHNWLFAVDRIPPFEIYD